MIFQVLLVDDEPHVVESISALLEFISIDN